MANKKPTGQTIRDWLTTKLGNPVMPSKEKNQIRELEEEERRNEEKQRKQENGEDYPASEHVRKSWM